VEGLRPLLRPADFAGITFATTATGTARATVRALDARPVLLRNNVSWQALPRGLGGLESQLHAIAGNQYFHLDPYVDANVVLWPRPLVVFANAKLYASLSPRERDVLQLAARDALAGSTQAAERDEAGAASQLCRGLAAGSGLKLVSARPADLLALRHAVAPVYRVLEQDPQTRSLIAQIESLKHRLSVPADVHPRCRRATTPPPGRGVLDGVYRRDWSAQQEAKVEQVPVANAIPENWGKFVLVIERNHFAFTQENARACTWQYGTLTVKGTRMAWSFANGGGIAPTNSENKPGEFFVMRWSLYRGTLTLDAIAPPLGQLTYQRTSTTPSPEALSRRCPPPKKAFP
jgi:hypothetical protein